MLTQQKRDEFKKQYESVLVEDETQKSLIVTLNTKIAKEKQGSRAEGIVMLYGF